MVKIRVIQKTLELGRMRLQRCPQDDLLQNRRDVRLVKTFITPAVPLSLLRPVPCGRRLSPREGQVFQAFPAIFQPRTKLHYPTALFVLCLP